MFGIGPQELLLILVIALVVVGPRKLPEIGRSLGKGLREVRKAQDEVRKTIQVNLDDEPAPAPARPRAHRPSVPAGDDEEPTGTGSDLAASAGAAGASVGEVSKTLGRGLAELRKAREEIQRTFRVDLGDPPASPARRSPGPPTAGETEESPPVAEEHPAG